MEKDLLDEIREEFDACEEAERDQRKQSEADLKFSKLGEQWDQADIDMRKNTGRPCLTINRCPAFTKQVTNDARLNRAQIKVQPVGGGADKMTADIQSDLIRNIETASQATQAYDRAFDFAVNGGVGYFRVNLDYTDDDAWDQDITIGEISNPASVYGDYESTAPTSIDWKRAFVTDWYTKASFEDKFGGDYKASSFEVGSKDFDAKWFEDKGNRIRVAEYWKRFKVPAKLLRLSNGMVMFEEKVLEIQDLLYAQGVIVEGERETKTWKVKQSIATGSDVVEEIDWPGKYIPIIPMYGEEANIAGKRYFFSLIHRAKDAQRLYNYQRSLAAELGALQPKAPWIGPKGMFTSDADRWATANTTPHAYLEYDVVPEQASATPQRQMFQGPPAGVMQEALMAADDMKSIMGIYDASLGARSNETSGRAIMARQREGDTSTFDFLDNRNRAVEHGGRIILDLLPKVYSTERIMRAVQEDGSTYTIPVNQPVVMQAQAQAAMQGQQIPQQPPEQNGPPQYQPVSQLPPELAQRLQAVTRIFDLTAGKYDVTVTAGPSFNSRREEAATQMMEFIRVFPQSAGLIGDLLAKNLDWPGSEQVAERLKAMLPPQARGQVDPMVTQLQQMLQTQDQQAKQAVATLQGQIAQLQKQMADKTADNALKARELDIKAAEAETKRMDVLKPAAQPVQQVDPLKVEELRLKDRELRIQEFEAETDRIKAEIERLKVMGATVTPEQIHALVNQTVAQAVQSMPAQSSETLVIVPQPEDPEEPEDPESSEGQGTPEDGAEQKPPEGGFFMGEPPVPGELMQRPEDD